MLHLNVMNELLYDLVLDGLPSVRIDAMLGDSIFFLVLNQPRDVRRLRSATIEIARCTTRKDRRRGILVLQDPLISLARLQTEWEGLESVLRPDLFSRLSMVVQKKGLLQKLFGDVPPEAFDHIETVIDHSRMSSSGAQKRSSDAFSDILRVLLIHWFRKSSPVTSKDLGHETGYSYPSIAETLEKLEPWLIRFSDRRVALQSFPQEAWFKLIAQSEEVRSTQGFAVSSGRPRPTEMLVEKLQELRRSDIAIGGTPGARHYFPGIDLIGNPRMDIVIESRSKKDVPVILRKLDPGLHPVERGELPQVVIHTLYRPVSFFQSDDSERFWADEVECLLDLHESRLEFQAIEFQTFLKDRARA